MIRGLTVSVLVHGSVLAMAVVTWSPRDNGCEAQIERLRQERPGISPVEIIMQLPQCAGSADLPIDFVEIGRVSDIAATRRSQPEPAPEQPPPPEPVPEPPPEPVPEPPPEPRTAPPPQPERVVPDPRQPPPAPKRAAEPEKPPEPDRRRPPAGSPPVQEPDELAFLADFEDTLRSKQAAPRAQAPAPDEAAADGDRDQRGVGDRRGNTASLQAAMRAKIRPCWTPVSDLPPEHQIIVTVRVNLNRDGTIDGSPELVRPATRPVGRSGIAVDRALRAVRKCAAYRLPPDDYEEWKQIDVAIGPER